MDETNQNWGKMDLGGIPYKYVMFRITKFPWKRWDSLMIFLSDNGNVYIGDMVALY